jgi:hypothetical protein
MEQSFRDYFMTPFHTEILTGSYVVPLNRDQAHKLCSGKVQPRAIWL